MIKNTMKTVPYSIDNDIDFINFTDLTKGVNYEMVDIKSAMNEIKRMLFDGIKYSDEGFLNEILRVTNRFDDIIDKVIKL